MKDVIESGYYESLLGYNNADWYVNEVINLENKMAFFFKNTKEDINMIEEDGEDYRNNIICQFCEKEILFDKVRNPCHLTGKYRGPVRNNCIKNVTQKQSKFIPFAFPNFSKYGCHLFF